MKTNDYKSRGGTPDERFWAKVNKAPGQGPAGECWEWQGCRNKRGYGQFNPYNSTAVLSHRFSYEQRNGPIPDNCLILHSCDNASCVNPAHLKAGTQSHNMQDMAAKGRQWQQAKTHCKNGHEFTPENTTHGLTKSGAKRICNICRRAVHARIRQKKKE